MISAICHTLLTIIWLNAWFSASWRWSWWAKLRIGIRNVSPSNWCRFMTSPSDFKCTKVRCWLIHCWSFCTCRQNTTNLYTAKARFIPLSQLHSQQQISDTFQNSRAKRRFLLFSETSDPKAKFLLLLELQRNEQSPAALRTAGPTADFCYSQNSEIRADFLLLWTSELTAHIFFRITKHCTKCQ